MHPQMALTAPYLRIPLVLSFLRPRPNVLLDVSLRQVILCALFEPLAAAPIVPPPSVPACASPSSAALGVELANAIEVAVGPLSILPVPPSLRACVLSDATGMMQVPRCCFARL